ncbi:MAG: hypothetical protein LBV70_06685 [Candidatus Adiutrix sp.]|jgi:hypothetical protein|nr:hypothetical protein [Candidatus Adiutrix sp.]
MKKLASLLALVLTLSIFSIVTGADESSLGPAKITNVPPPPFTLEPNEHDGPNRLRLKATLRLLKHAQITAKALKACGDTAGADQALEGFQARNGNSLRMLMTIISKNGGMPPEVKALLDREVTVGTAELLAETDCLTLSDQVFKNARDIYKAPELAEDYALVKSQP